MLARKPRCCCSCCVCCTEGEVRWEVQLCPEDYWITGLFNSIWIPLLDQTCGWQGGKGRVLLLSSLKYEMNSLVLLLSWRMCRCSHSGSHFVCCTVAKPPQEDFVLENHEIPLQCMNWRAGGRRGRYRTDTSVVHSSSCSPPYHYIKNQTLMWQSTQSWSLKIKQIAWHALCYLQHLGDTNM